jgi:hypothetical protein
LILTSIAESNTVSAPTVQSRLGTYALLLASATDALIRVGRLGNLRLQPGYYVYVGSFTKTLQTPNGTAFPKRVYIAERDKP